MTTRKRVEIGIVASVPAEAEIFRRELTKKVRADGSCYEGSLAGKRVLLILSGMGKVNAAHAATRLILEHSPSLVMNIGIGGAYPGAGLKVGDIAVAEREIYADEGVLLKDGFHGTDYIGIPLVRKASNRYFNTFVLNEDLVKRAVKAAQLITHHSSLITVRKGTFLTLSTCTGTKKRASELQKRYGALCENMEGAAVAHICTRYRIPMLELRGISNIVEDRDVSRWNIRLAAENCQKAALECIRQL